MKIDKDNQLGATAAFNAHAILHSMRGAKAIAHEESTRISRLIEELTDHGYKCTALREEDCRKWMALLKEDLEEDDNGDFGEFLRNYKRTIKQYGRAVEEDDNSDYRERMFQKGECYISSWAELNAAAQRVPAVGWEGTGSRIEVIVPGSSECFPYEPMRDPVVVASGETYDGANINASSQRLVSPMTAVPRNMGGDESSFMTRGQKNECDILLREIAQGNVCREATRELREMTRKAPYRAYLGYWKTGAIPLLVSLLSSSDPQTQENAVTVLHNLSLCVENLTAIVALGAIPSIVQVLRSGGTMEARGNAAATLFHLAKVNENKQKIAASGAIPALVDLLRDGNPIAKKDSLGVLGILCLDNENRIPCVREGIIPLLMELLSNHSECLDGSLELLLVVAARQEGVEKVGNAGAVPYLMDVIKDGCSSPRSKENAVAILHAICSNDRSHLKEFRHYRNGYIIALTDLSKSGTPNVQRKASAFLDMIMKQEQISIKLAKEEEEDKRLKFTPLPPL